ncbi:CoaE-domain-containing protein [Microstroma glucosiphilum]|uniref:CoaE-domain-containing protein n=1 Tax=Pseudomicrostroma glucosiphilum TaxID=1684307 RepID=A0A316U116_9BASI|nr:CoaE-domain-containing protein [Pseudomicrostroma glucosiphilum]PWN18987.1 CoaE-domain-containing protein [Pseudomicrostroma glucosiphilum]
MLIVGLTGGIASGKSTVSSLLQDKHHLPLIDLDLLAREVVRPTDSSRTLSKLVAHFGSGILQEDGTLDRPVLGRLVFGNEQERKVLNAITHRAIRKRMAWTLLWNWVKGVKVTVVDTPLLIEAGLWRWCGELVVVWCSPEDQLSRMLSRDGPKGLTEDEAQSRLSSQWPLRSKLPYADVVLDNSSALTSSSSTSPSEGGGASEILTAQVGDLVRSWRGYYGGVFGTLYWLAEWLVPPFGLLMAALTLVSRWGKVKTRLRESEESDQQAVERRSIGSG